MTVLQMPRHMELHQIQGGVNPQRPHLMHPITGELLLWDPKEDIPTFQGDLEHLLIYILDL